MQRDAESPVLHPARLELHRALVEHPHAPARIAAMRRDDPAHDVAELLVRRQSLRGALEDPLRDLGLAAKEREVREVLGRAGRALPREAVALRELAALHLRAREAEERVAPDRRAVRAQP